MEIGRIVILVLATVLVFVWMVLAVKYESVFQPLVQTIDKNQYKYPELFCIGLALMKILKIDSKSKKARKRIKEIAQVQGKMYAEYYFYVMNGAKWTYGFTVLVFLVLIGALGNSPMAAFLGVVLAGLVMWYVEELLNDKLNARRDELLADLPQMLSKLTLLVNAGMTTLNAWKKVAETSERVLYREMREVVAETQNGKDELEAYMNFADRCSIKEVRRFTSTIIQNKLRGNREEAYFLKELSDEMWEEKKHLVRRKGEAAKSKLLIPTTMIFIGILIMVMVPAFMGMNL
ncbi:secretion protein F [Lachnospiraceae bacterium WCA-9-b2]|jgi:tight adherence protein C|uniref:Secretion protein F n=1 Tax=Sporofaciens musculi TaxID=2681861 RepID=A0A7X3MDG9_9FIRM|nr:type II secretion system F family protein [Sporofaciens musculi]MCI9421843.1 secretion protein F [Dorea sp.]MXP74419.1 secretion protein F [Sporofaciens musculi]